VLLIRVGRIELLDERLLQVVLLESPEEQGGQEVAETEVTTELLQHLVHAQSSRTVVTLGRLLRELD